MFRFIVRFSTPTVMRRDVDRHFTGGLLHDGALRTLSDGSGDDEQPANGDAVYECTGSVQHEAMRGSDDHGAASMAYTLRRLLSEIELLTRIRGGVSGFRVIYVGMTTTGADPQAMPEPDARDARTA